MESPQQYLDFNFILAKTDHLTRLKSSVEICVREENLPLFKQTVMVASRTEPKEIVLYWFRPLLTLETAPRDSFSRKMRFYSNMKNFGREFINSDAKLCCCILETLSHHHNQAKIVCVPSSDPEKSTSWMHRVVETLHLECPSLKLQRTHKITKSVEGNKDYNSHIESLQVNLLEEIPVPTKIILLDDNFTTGVTLASCREKLLEVCPTLEIIPFCFTKTLNLELLDRSSQILFQDTRQLHVSFATPPNENEKTYGLPNTLFLSTTVITISACFESGPPFTAVVYPPEWDFLRPFIEGGSISPDHAIIQLSKLANPNYETLFWRTLEAIFMRYESRRLVNPQSSRKSIGHDSRFSYFYKRHLMGWLLLYGKPIEIVMDQLVSWILSRSPDHSALFQNFFVFLPPGEQVNQLMKPQNMLSMLSKLVGGRVAQSFKVIYSPKSIKSLFGKGKHFDTYLKDRTLSHHCVSLPPNDCLALRVAVLDSIFDSWNNKLVPSYQVSVQDLGLGNAVTPRGWTYTHAVKLFCDSLSFIPEGVVTLNPGLETNIKQVLSCQRFVNKKKFLNEWNSSFYKSVRSAVISAEQEKRSYFYNTFNLPEELQLQTAFTTQVEDRTFYYCPEMKQTHYTTIPTYVCGSDTHVYHASPSCMNNEKQELCTFEVMGRRPCVHCQNRYQLCESPVLKFKSVVEITFSTEILAVQIEYENLHFIRVAIPQINEEKMVKGKNNSNFERKK